MAREEWKLREPARANGTGFGYVRFHDQRKDFQRHTIGTEIFGSKHGGLFRSNRSSKGRRKVPKCWGGDFWFYTQGNGVGSTVTHYKYATDKSYVNAVADTGFVIVGAGVSTCAPTTPPN